MSDSAELATVVSLYEAGKYVECRDSLSRLLDPDDPAPLQQPDIIESARVYYAACLIGSGRPNAADAPLRDAIRANPQMKPPDGLIFPQPVIERYFRVREELVAEIRKAEQARMQKALEAAREQEQKLMREQTRIKKLEALAREETVVVQNRRLFAFVPFGVGQLQNRQEALGYTLMVSELVLLGATVTAIAVQSHIQSDIAEFKSSGATLRADEVNPTLRAWTTVRNVSFWSFAAVAVGGIVQANLAFEPEFRETRPRVLPESVSPPSAPRQSRLRVNEVGAAPTPDGLTFTVRGSF